VSRDSEAVKELSVKISTKFSVAGLYR